MHVSIIITSYNYGKYIARCIDSCLGQEMPEDSFEVIVVDDCSAGSAIIIADTPTGKFLERLYCNLFSHWISYPDWFAWYSNPEST